MHDTLPLDPRAASRQTPQDYVEQVTATTGMPWASVRRNMAKVHGVLSRVDEVLGGLTRGLDLSVLDEGVGEHEGHLLSFFPRTDALGVVLPSNSPGVHSLWAPATVLEDAAGAQAGQRRAVDAAPHHPGVHRGGRAGRGVRLLPHRSRRRQRDPAVVRPRHGVRRRRLDEALEGATRASRCTAPATARWSSARTLADDWERYVDVIAESISNNGGRSCVNASGVWVTRHADRIAEALAARLAQVTPRAADDPEAVLAPFADPATAHRISAMIDQDLAPGEGDAGRAGPRRLGQRPRTRAASSPRTAAPTCCRRSCAATPSHALANREFLFPYASVVEVPAERLPDVPRTVARGHVHLERSGLPARASSPPRTSIASTSARSRRRRSAGTSRTRATCSSTCTRGGRFRGRRES